MFFKTIVILILAFIFLVGLFIADYCSRRNDSDKITNYDRFLEEIEAIIVRVVGYVNITFVNYNIENGTDLTDEELNNRAFDEVFDLSKKIVKNVLLDSGKFGYHDIDSYDDYMRVLIAYHMEVDELNMKLYSFDCDIEDITPEESNEENVTTDIGDVEQPMEEFTTDGTENIYFYTAETTTDENNKSTEE